MAERPQILMISFGFPPNSEVGTLRVTRFCRYLPEHGIVPVVLTAVPEAYRWRDATVPVPEGVRVVRAPLWRTPLDWYAGWKRGGKGAAGRAASPPAGQAGGSAAAAAGAGNRQPPEDGKGFIRKHLLALLQTPDPYWGWYRPALTAARQILEQEKIAAIVSTGPPWIAHLLARKLSQRYRLPWLADFRDPWAGVTGAGVPWWKRRLQQHLETDCVRRARRVICNTGALRDLFVRTYPALPAEKFVVLTNGFDHEPSPPPPRPPGGAKLCLHTGWLYAGRRIDTFCQAVDSLIRSGRLPPGALRIVFLGDADPALAADARRRAPELFARGVVEFHPRVPWQEAQRMMWDADILLLFQGNLPLQVPAKFFDYLPTGKPLFAVVQRGALSELIESTGAGLWADPDDPAAIAERFYELLGRGPATPQQLDDWRRRFHYRHLTGRLAEIIRETVAAAQPPQQFSARRDG